MVNLNEDEVKVRILGLGGKLVGRHSGEGCQVKESSKARKSVQSFLYRGTVSTSALLAVVRLLNRLLLKPVLFSAVTLAFLRRLWKRRFTASRLELCGLLLSLDFVICRFKVYLQDPVLRQKLFGNDNLVARAGVHHSGKDGVMKQILENLPLELAHSYRPPWYALHGDLSTLIAALSYRKRPLKYIRSSFPSKVASDEEHGITLDWAFPNTPSKEEPNRVVLLLAGVGGDSDSSYIRDAVHEVVDKGWIAVVFGPRGLGNTIKVQKVENIFNPATHLEEIVEVLHVVNTICASPKTNIVLVGFSLGGIMLCNLLGRCHNSIPSSVVGAVAVSGAFKCGTLLWERYMETYQPIIVPNILGEILNNYGHQIEAIFTEEELSRLFSSTTYAQLFTNFFSKIAARTGVAFSKFEDWVEAQEGFAFRDKIRVPLLLIAACDDPFHHPDLIGSECDKEYPSYDNPNVAYWITKEGGHVAWPEQLGSYTYLNRIISSFVRASTEKI